MNEISINNEVERQFEIIKRGAVEIISEIELKDKLKASVKDKKPLNIKAGFDPTAPDLHLGHTVLLEKLRQFQELGHNVYFLIGDFTGRIGDPTGRSEIRKQLTPREVRENAQTYKRQVSKILDIKRLRIVFNSRWLDKMHGLEFARLLSHYTATRLLERDDFSLRMKERRPLYMSELIYPILQGYDSVVLEADIEVGGSDQKFNLLVGRDLQKDFNKKQQVVITMPLLEGTDGIQKMSKSYGNYIGINEPAKDIFGKLMSISDELMVKYYELLTNEDLSLLKSMHPKDAKVKLAKIIVSKYYSEQEADFASDEFKRVFSQKDKPKEIPEYKTDGKKTIVMVLSESGIAKTGNEARRLIKQGAVSFNDSRIESEAFIIKESGILKVGAHRFLKVLI